MTQPLPDVQPSPRLPKAALLSLISTLSGVQAFWRTDKTPAVPGTGPALERARVWLRVNSYVTNGIDEERAIYNATTQANDRIVVGQRQFTLSLRAESVDANLEAYDLCERIRFRLRSLTARAIFAPANLSLRDVQPMSVLETIAAGRVMRVAVMDVRWNLVVFADPNDGGGGIIETVNSGGFIPSTG